MNIKKCANLLKSAHPTQMNSSTVLIGYANAIPIIITTRKSPAATTFHVHPTPPLGMMIITKFGHGNAKKTITTIRIRPDAFISLHAHPTLGQDLIVTTY